MLRAQMSKSPARATRIRALRPVLAVRHNATQGNQNWDPNDIRNPARPHPFWKRVFPNFHRQEEEDEIHDWDRMPGQYYDFDTVRAYHRKGSRARRTKKKNWLELYDWTVQDWNKKDSPNYLKLTDEQMKRGYIGYLSEDEEDEDLMVPHAEFGMPYRTLTEDYKKEVLADKCLGRPSYEWQIPFGVDDLFGYRSIITAADVMGNQQAQTNLEFAWVNKGTDTAAGGILLENPKTGQTLTVLTSGEAAGALQAIKPDCVAFQYAADKMLPSIAHMWSPTAQIDQRGCVLALLWSYVAVNSMFWPATVPAQFVAGSALAATNLFFLRRTYFEPEDLRLKSAMKVCRDQQCKVIFGDWLEEDYDERYFHTRLNDQEAKHRDQSGADWQPLLDRMVNSMKVLFTQSSSSVERISSGDFPGSFRDDINLRRIDIFAHSLNSSKYAWLNPDPDEQDPDEIPQRLVAVVRPIDDLPSDAVVDLLVDRLTGATPCTLPMKYTEEHERLEVVF